ncbi:MAG: hypothetical protein IJD95_00605 [Clostridia bacterium]|nr:hypothetical protein [Clostridia bacterium]
MKTVKKETKITIIAVIIFALIVSAFVAAFLIFGDDGNVGAKTVTVTVVHKDASQKVVTINTDAETLGAALIEGGVIGNIESGMIFTVDNETANGAAEEWWCITKGGEMLWTGVNDTMIADGDRYEITFTVGYEGW